MRQQQQLRERKQDEVQRSVAAAVGSAADAANAAAAAAQHRRLQHRSAQLRAVPQFSELHVRIQHITAQGTRPLQWQLVSIPPPYLLKTHQLPPKPKLTPFLQSNSPLTQSAA